MGDGIAEIAFDALQHRLNRMRRLGDVDNAAFAHADRWDGAERDNAHASGAFGFADGQRRVGRADFKGGYGIS